MNILKTLTFKTISGKSPFNAWLKGIDSSIRGIVRARIDRVRLGNMGDCEPIKGSRKIAELRIHVSPGYRIYFGMKDNTIVILLVGGIKNTQEKDILKAKQYWKECGEGILNDYLEEFK